MQTDTRQALALLAILILVAAGACSAPAPAAEVPPTAGPELATWLGPQGANPSGTTNFNNVAGTSFTAADDLNVGDDATIANALNAGSAAITGTPNVIMIKEGRRMVFLISVISTK